MQSFENFFICPENKLAYAIAKEIASPPRRNSNPFFLYGKSGLGKSHLLKAIKNHLYNTMPDMDIKYVPVNILVEEFISSIQMNKQNEFKVKYRNTDILLIDDLDYLKDKPETQQELLHIISHLQHLSKQVVVSSCDSPLNMTLGNHGLLREGNSLIIKIDPPGFESRLAYLQLLAKENLFRFTVEMLKDIAKKIPPNFSIIGSLMETIYKVSEIYQNRAPLETIKSVIKHFLVDTPV